MVRFIGLFAGFVLVAFLSALAVVACGGQPPAAPTSSSTSYRLCQLDLHCPGGMYCSAGVCDTDCTADSDCAAGQSCDLRGRCNVSGTVAPPPTYAGHLVAPPSTLNVSPTNPTASFTLQNDGVDAIGRFHVISDDPNVEATPASGTLASGASVQIQVQVAAGFTGSGATIHVLTTGGRADVSVRDVSTLSGRLQGTVEVNQPFALGTAPFAIEIAGSPDAMTGSVDGSASLLWPQNAPVTATDNGTSFTASFAFVSEPGQAGDPLFDVPVQRSVQLTGTHSTTNPLIVTGDYAEIIEGLPGGLVSTNGSFQLQRISVATGVISVPQPTLTVATPAPLPSACACTAAGCTASATTDADWFFTNGFPFEQWEAGSSYQNGQCTLTSGFTGNCDVPTYAECALDGFNAVGADDGVADVLRAQATLALLTGKSALASVLQPAAGAFGTTLNIVDDIAALQAASTQLELGLHGAPGGGGLLASANLNVARTARVMAQFGKPSKRDIAQLDDVQRFGGVVAASLFATAEQADRQQRNGSDGQVVLANAQQAASGALLDLAAIGAVLDSPSETVSGLATSFAPLAGTFGKVLKFQNAAGYASTYVPIIYDPTNPTDDLYNQVKNAAQDADSTAQSAEQALIAENANVDTAETALEDQIAEAATTAALQISTLCGTNGNAPPAAACGQNGGAIGTDLDDMNAAAAALQEAKDRHSAAALKLETLNQQAQQELQDQADELVEQINAENEIQIVDQAKVQEQQVNEGIQCALGIVQAAMSGAAAAGGAAAGTGGGSVNVSGLGSCGSLITSVAYNDSGESAEEDEAKADEQITLWLGSQQVTDDAMVIAVEDAQADLTAAGDQVVEEMALFDAATSKFDSDEAQLRQILDNIQQANSEAELQPAADPSFRLLQDSDAVAWATALALSRTWCFLTAQALAYTLVQSFPEQGLCLTGESAAEVHGFFLNMDQEYKTDQMNNSNSQTRTDQISMQAILGITKSQIDPVTGQTLTTDQQFQALLALPTNRDSAGNLQFRFTTSIAAGNPIFATDVGADLIESVVGNLVGTQIGGPTTYLTLIQSGNSQLRSYVDGSLVQYSLGSKTATVPAGINLGSPAGSSANPISASTDLFGRSVGDSGWTLLFNSADEPTDVSTMVTEIQDIELWITHQARTVQVEPL